MMDSNIIIPNNLIKNKNKNKNKNKKFNISTDLLIVESLNLLFFPVSSLKKKVKNFENKEHKEIYNYLVSNNFIYTTKDDINVDFEFDETYINFYNKKTAKDFINLLNDKFG